MPYFNRGFLANCALFAAVMSALADAPKPAAHSKSAKPKPPNVISINLPPATPGLPYMARLQGPRNLAYPFQCAENTQSLLPGMYFDCATLTIVGSRTSDLALSHSTERKAYTIRLQLTDNYGDTQAFQLQLLVADLDRLPLIPLERSAGKAGANSAPVARPAALIAAANTIASSNGSANMLPVPRLFLATKLQEGSTEVSGSVDNLPQPPGPAKAPARAATPAGAASAAQPDTQPVPAPSLSAALCVFKASSAGGGYNPSPVECTRTGGTFALLAGSTPSSSVQTAAVSTKDGTFTLKLASALLPGQSAAVVLLPPAGKAFADGSSAAAGPLVTIPVELPEPKITISSVVQSGISSISGVISPMPDPALPAPGKADDPPSNLPLISVCLVDVTAGKAAPSLACPEPPSSTRNQLAPNETTPYLADLISADSKSVAAVPVASDGRFTVNLKNPLTQGQRVTIEVVPPPGRAFAVPGGGDDPPALSVTVTTTSTIAVAQPVITSQLAEGVAIIKGTATPSSKANGTINVALRVMEPLSSPAEMPRTCPTLDRLGSAQEGGERTGPNNQFAALSASNSTSQYVPVDENGNFSATLTTPLAAGQLVQAIQILPAGTYKPNLKRGSCSSIAYLVPDTLNWGRVRIYFAGGILVANDSSGFSQAHQFYALNLDKTWLVPGDYLRKSTGHDYGKDYDACHSQDCSASKLSWWQRHSPGVSTYFETRLTAIPATAVNASNPSGGANPNNASGTGATPGATNPANSSGSANFLSTQKTVRVGTGAYFPFLLTRWDWRQQPNALFIAPIAKVGFDTITGPTTQTVVDPSGGTSSQTYEQIYNYYSLGGRIGHMELTHTTERAPEIYSYLDVNFGPYSNLESLICQRTQIAPSSGSDPTGSGCRVAYPRFYGTTPGTPPYIFEARKRIWRLDLEGLLKIPYSPIYVGFNANIGQKAIGAEKLDPAFRAPDDLRFFFGTKLDIGQVLQKVGVPTQ